MSRMTRDELYLNIAESFAMRSTCLRGQVGAVIVVENHIVSGGYNGAPPGLPHCTEAGCEGGVKPEWPQGGKALIPTADLEYYQTEQFPNGCTRATHAEANAIAFAARHGTPCVEGTMYCTHAMCAKCAALVVACGIRRVVYLKPYRASALDMLDKANIEVIKYGLE